MPSSTPRQPGKVLRTDLWRNAELWRLWCWCWFSAARKLRTTQVNMMPVRLAAGQVAATLEVICEQTGLGPEVVRKNLAVGKSAGLLELRAAHWGLRITIVGWQYPCTHTPPPFPE